MYNLIRSELFKLYKSKGFKIMTLVNGIVIVLIVLSVYYSVNEMPEMMQNVQISLEGENIPKTGLEFFTMILAGEGLGMFGALLAGIFICGDFENFTIQEGIACGYSRWDIILSKSIVYFIGVAILSITSSVVAGVLGTELFGFGAEATSDVILKLMAMIGTITLAGIAQTSICILFAFWFKKSSVAIGIGIGVFTLGPKILAGFTSKIEWLSKVIEYMPLNLAVRTLTLDAMPVDYITVITISIAIIIGVLVITWNIFKKAEIK